MWMSFSVNLGKCWWVAKAQHFQTRLKYENVMKFFQNFEIKTNKKTWENFTDFPLNYIVALEFLF